ncbi:MAG: phenylalanine--tRNA ligase subunit beta [Ignavibacteriales bacterium]|nr:phenylalanine--tRNA ligase subunit beta [Ignavibacteriales bacterium]
MKVSLNWLKEFVDFDLTSEELAHQLTMRGLEVESIEHLGDKYKNFVIGEVLEVAKHPNANKLSVCKVDVGNDFLKIVCGAPNVAPQQKVVVGLVDAVVPRNQHDPNGKPFVLSHVKIRGEDSFGMICSEYELDLGDDANGILVLENNVHVGVPFANYLGLTDTVFEIGVTPNRPDCLSHIGVAREVASLVGKKLKLPTIKISEAKQKASEVATIEIQNAELCPRYSSRVLFNVKVSDSPKWLKELLTAVGIRPINNIVDVTNFVLLETGQPLHAFDYDKLAKHKIVVKNANEGEIFTTLDGKERKLKSETLMICDGEKNVAIAGVMGGMNSEISETTKNVLLESAYFNPRSVRRTSKYLGLSTDASQRFERGTNPNITEYAATRAAQLMNEIAGGEILSDSIDIYPNEIHPKEITLRVERTNNILGTTLTKPQIKNCLTSIGIEVKKNEDDLLCSVPTFRPDIFEEIDLIEEVARVFGYDNIETKMRASIQFSDKSPKVEIADELREWLVGSGWNEIVANSMQEKSVAQLSLENIVEMLNPISKEMAALRTSLIPGMLNIIRHNIFQSQKNLRLFEFGKNYFRNASFTNTFVKNYLEEEHLLLAISGNANQISWDTKERSVDVFDIKGEVETLFSKLNIGNVNLEPLSSQNIFLVEAMTISFDGKQIGLLGKIRSDILKKFDVEHNVFVADIFVEQLRELKKQERKFVPLPKFPTVQRDFAFVVNEHQSIGEMLEALKTFGRRLDSSSGEIVRSVNIFDIYQGKGLPDGKKSCAFSVEFRSDEATLTDEVVEKISRTIVSEIQKKFNAELRA